MKTIVDGNLEVTKEYKYFECLNCGWIGKADKTEYKYCATKKKEIVGVLNVHAVDIRLVIFSNATD